MKDNNNNIKENYNHFNRNTTEKDINQRNNITFGQNIKESMNSVTSQNQQTMNLKNTDDEGKYKNYNYHDSNEKLEDNSELNNKCIEYEKNNNFKENEFKNKLDKENLSNSDFEIEDEDVISKFSQNNKDLYQNTFKVISIIFFIFFSF